MTVIHAGFALAQNVVLACRALGLPAPSSVSMSSGDNVGDITWTPDLSAQDLATVNAIVKLAIGSTLLTKAERDNLEPDFNTLRLYANAASPTNAQTIAAVKAIIDVLRAFVRD